MVPQDPYSHLEFRCQELVQKYLDPIISSAQAALQAGNALPDPDFDAIAAFRLLSHAELEGYFEEKAKRSLRALELQFQANRVATSKLSALVFFYILKRRPQLQWQASTLSDDTAVRQAEALDFKRLAQDALGYGRQFVSANNGIKESSLHTLSALIGYFPDELDDLLVKELDQFGKKRGDVAHNSWLRNTRTFDSAEIEATSISCSSQK